MQHGEKKNINFSHIYDLIIVRYVEQKEDYEWVSDLTFKFAVGLFLRNLHFLLKFTIYINALFRH